MPTKTRCEWCSTDPLYQRYHDEEWGVPSYDEQHLFELLILEGMQAGLSWITVLKKREHYRKITDNFNAQKMATFSDKKLATLLEDPGIIRNKLKVNALRKNAQAYLQLCELEGGLSNYMWHFVEGQPIQNQWQSLKDIPAKTERSEIISKDLKKRGFTFVGPTIIYAYMQAVGIVNDHTVDCFRYSELNS